MEIRKFMENAIKNNDFFPGIGSCQKFRTDLKRKSFYIGSTPLIKNGEINLQWIKRDDGKMFSIEIESCQNDFSSFLDTAELLFLQYESSVVTKASRKLKPNFVEKTSDELSVKEMSVGIDREIALMHLELFVLSAAMTGLKWPDDKKWYLQRGNMILYKEWFQV